MRKIFSVPVACLAVFIGATTTLHAATIYVPDNFKTINEAVKNASPKDTIIVNEGNYAENIVITKPLTIRSSKGPDASMVHALIKTEPVFKVSNAYEAAIIGFTVSGSLTAGIYFYNSQNGQILDNKIINNGNGVLLYSSNKNNLTNNNANLNAWDGIMLWSSHKNTLKDNKVLRNRYAIVLSNSDDNTLINNSTWSNIYIILPIVLIYIGILVYLIQKNLIRLLYRE